MTYNVPLTNDPTGITMPPLMASHEWVVLQSKPNMERRVAAALAAANHVYFLPLAPAVSRVNLANARHDRVLLTSYLFVQSEQADPVALWCALGTRQVRSTIRVRCRLSQQLLDSELRSLYTECRRRMYPELTPRADFAGRFRVGDRVTTNGGGNNGISGIVVRPYDPATERTVLRITILNQVVDFGIDPRLLCTIDNGGLTQLHG